MATKERVFKALKENKGKAVSGERLARSLDISRTAVWKAIKSLRNEGYPIEAGTNKGYMLAANLDYLSEDSIIAGLDEDLSDFSIHLYETLESTNKTAKEMAFKDVDHNIAVIADHQTNGRGRLGRDFFSPKGSGLYISLLLKPSFDMSKSVLITTAAAVAAVRAIKKFSDGDLKIKWVNDIYMDDKKICGILTEAVTDFETGQIQHIVLGFGINCFEAEYPEGLSEKISFIGGNFSRNILAADIINETMKIFKNIENRKFLEEYKKLSMVIDEEIDVYKPAACASRAAVPIKAIALGIDSDGGLIIRHEEDPFKGHIETLNSGEISIRVKKHKT